MARKITNDPKILAGFMSLVMGAGLTTGYVPPANAAMWKITDFADMTNQNEWYYCWI